MPIDIEGVDLEEMMWRPTGELRFFRPPMGSDHDIRLEQLYERTSGERSWRPVKTVLAD